MNNLHSNVLYLFTNDDLKITNNSNELVFQILKTSKPEIFELYLKNNDSITKVDVAYISSINQSKFVNSLFNGNKENIKVKCKYNNIFNKWEPIEHTNDLINHINDIHVK